jgi:hypothetical protein
VYEFLPARAVTAGPLRSLQRPWRVRWKEGTRTGYIWPLRVLVTSIGEAIANPQFMMVVWSRVSRRRTQQRRNLNEVRVVRQLFYAARFVATTYKKPEVVSFTFQNSASVIPFQTTAISWVIPSHASLASLPELTQITRLPHPTTQPLPSFILPKYHRGSPTSQNRTICSQWVTPRMNPSGACIAHRLAFGVCHGTGSGLCRACSREHVLDVGCVCMYVHTMYGDGF